MKKRFNITGTCRPEEHYMMDDTRRFAGIMEMVERGEYFVINRPRQYGKTTMLLALARELEKRDEYLPVKMNFQGISQSHYESSDTFAQFFFKELVESLRWAKKGFSEAQLQTLSAVRTLDDLSARITEVVRMINKKLVLLIDEVDASANYEPFLHLLGMLRTKFLNRDEPRHATFHSVVLAGVHDIKSLKFKLRNPEEAQYNSPWNIAADFKVVMEFYPNEIAHMLKEYGAAEGVQMDFEAMSEKLYYYTSGYPFLVSKLCKIVAEEILPQKADKSRWTLDDLEAAVQLLLKERNTNFDSLIKNLENNQELYRLVYSIILDGFHMPYDPNDSVIRIGEMYGIFKANDRVKIHNPIYEQVIYNYMTSRRLREHNNEPLYNFRENYIDNDGGLDLALVLRKFQAFMKEQYSNKNRNLIEREWRLIFLAFLKPIINGKGYDFKEVETSEEKRLDIVVTYLQWRYIIELKRWSGEKSHERGLNQLANYLDIHGVNEGWLLIFDDRQNPTWKEELIHHKGKEIFAVWV